MIVNGKTPKAYKRLLLKLFENPIWKNHITTKKTIKYSDKNAAPLSNPARKKLFPFVIYRKDKSRKKPTIM